MRLALKRAGTSADNGDGSKEGGAEPADDDWWRVPIKRMVHQADRGLAERCPANTTSFCTWIKQVTAEARDFAFAICDIIVGKHAKNEGIPPLFYPDDTCEVCTEPDPGQAPKRRQRGAL